MAYFINRHTWKYTNFISGYKTGSCMVIHVEAKEQGTSLQTGSITLKSYVINDDFVVKILSHNI